MYEENDTELSAELKVLRDTPERYASIATQVWLAMKLSDRKCVSIQCDEYDTCPRHSKIPQIVSRYIRMKKKHG